VKSILINEQIRSNLVQLIDETGNNSGKVLCSFALSRAKEKGFDLVMVALGPEDIPICKIIDYGKFKYEQSKKGTNHQHQKDDMKEMRIGINIGEHDLKFKNEKVKEFLKDGYKVKYVLTLSGREKYVQRDEAINKMNELLKIFEEMATWGQLNITSGKDNHNRKAMMVTTILVHKK